MEIIAKYDLSSVLLNMMTDPIGSITTVHDLACNTLAQMEAIDAAVKSSPADKVNPLEERYGKDEKGAKDAEKFLRQDGGVFDLITDYIGDDEAKTYHIKNAVSELLVKYLSGECAYFTNKLTDPHKVGKVSDKADLKSDFGEMRELIVHIAGIKGITPDECSYLEYDKQGKVRSTLAGIRGPRKGNDGTTGRYAKVYGLAWVIDGEEVQRPWNIPSLVRRFWTGADRIGKNTATLTDILDKETEWSKPDFTSKSFTINGHKVTVSRIVNDDDDDETDDDE